MNRTTSNLFVKWYTYIRIRFYQSVPVLYPKTLSQYHMAPKHSMPCHSRCTLKCEHEDRQLARPHRPQATPNRLIGESSRWFGYLQSLPAGIVDLPMFWNCEIPNDRFEDGAKAFRWLRGTEVERNMKRQPGYSLKTLVRLYSRWKQYSS